METTETIFKYPCLIKKNTKTLRTKLEKLGYNYVALVSTTNKEYNNLKEPWIFCAYNIYTCTDGPSYEDLKAIVHNPENFSPEPGKEISHETKEFTRHEENEFLEAASIKA